MVNKLSKAASGIPGFDEISYGGIPKGRTTLVGGTSGSGKTAFSTQFLYEGITGFGENGVFVTFEEKPEDIIKNAKSFGWDIGKLVKENKWAFVDASPDEADSLEVGQYNLGGFLARIEYAIKKGKAKRVAIDSVSALFTHYQDPGIIRRELYRLTARLKKLNVTCIMTAERPAEGEQISRYGIEEFVSDNLILLHNRLNSRGEREKSIEILKYRGLAHDSVETPLIIDNKGINIYPRPKPLLSGKGFTQKISTGIKGLDKMLYGGVYRNSTTLITGPSGTGKTVSVLHYIMEGARRKERSLLVEFEESSDQLRRNAMSFGWDLEKYVKSGLVKLLCIYPENLKTQLYYPLIRDLVLGNKIKRFAIDSLSAVKRITNEQKFLELVIGLNAFLKTHEVTSVLTNTTSELLGVAEIAETHLSTAADNIIILKHVELVGEMHRLISALKQRGSMCEKKLMEFEICKEEGLRILKPFKGAENLLSGSARRIQMELDRRKVEKDLITEAVAGRI